MIKRIGDWPHEEGYSVWENNDKELVAKIKAIKPKTDIKVGDTVTHWGSGECEILSFINDKELLVYSHKHDRHEVYRLEDEEAVINDDYLQDINDTYDVSDYFLDNFGVITDGNNIIYGIASRLENPFRKESYKEVNVAGKIYESIVISDYMSLRFEANRVRGAVSVFFDSNGNYVIRDYNFDMSQFKPCNPDEIRETKISEFIKIVDKHIDSNEIKYDESNEIYFTEKYAYKLNHNYVPFEFGYTIKLFLNIIPNQGTSYYHKGDSSHGYKPKKNVVIIGKDTLLNKLRGLIEEHYS